MHYWNKTNFNGLKEIADTLRQKRGYEGYARYCLLREKGLKKEALIELRSFIAQARLLSIEEQRSVACELAELYFHNRDVHQLLPQPAAAYLGEVLQQWCSEHPSSPEPYRWCGVICGNHEFFDLALREDPEDVISLCRLALQELQNIDFATHHLSESIFLGSPADADTALARAASYVMRLPTGEAKTRYMEEITHYRNLLSAWHEYQSSGRHMPFPKWSAERGYDFTFGSVIYYSEDQT